MLTSDYESEFVWTVDCTGSRHLEYLADCVPGTHLLGFTGRPPVTAVNKLANGVHTSGLTVRCPLHHIKHL